MEDQRENGIDLSNWSIDSLEDAVNTFREQHSLSRYSYRELIINNKN